MTLAPPIAASKASAAARRLAPFALLATAPFVAFPVGAAQPAAPFTVGNHGYTTLADAVNAIGDRDGTILIAPGTYRQCVVQSMGSVAYRAATPGSVVFDGAICEGKAALVLRGRSATIEGITFQNLRVPDGNGAGIRLEHGDLTIDNSIFRASEEGILTADDPEGTISIDRTSFSHLGRCDRGLSCAHSLYVGHYGRLIVTRSRFEAGDGGHYLKTRSARVEITNNSFDDSHGHTTNYMIDLSNGATGIVSGNIMVQGRDKENYSAFITVAPEGRERSSAGLVVRDNRAAFVPGLARTSTFVANWTDDKVTIAGNQLAPGIKLTDRR